MHTLSAQVSKSMHWATRQPKCAHRVQGAPLISNTARLGITTIYSYIGVVHILCSVLLSRQPCRLSDIEHSALPDTLPIHVAYIMYSSPTFAEISSKTRPSLRRYMLYQGVQNTRC